MIHTNQVQLGQHGDWVDVFAHYISQFEKQIDGVYDDLANTHNATIGTGFNLREGSVLNAVLDALGIFANSDVAEVARRQQLGLPGETQAQRDARYQAIVDDFVAIVAGANLSRPATGVNPGDHASEQALQSALNAEAQNYGVQLFRIDQAQSASIVRQLVEGLSIGQDMNGGLPRGHWFETDGLAAELDYNLGSRGVAISHVDRNRRLLPREQFWFDPAG